MLAVELLRWEGGGGAPNIMRAQERHTLYLIKSVRENALRLQGASNKSLPSLQNQNMPATSCTIQVHAGI